MYESGKKVCFRDENFKSCFGTIEAKISEDSTLVTLKVKRDSDGKIFIVHRINPYSENVQRVEDNYRKNGHY